MARIRKPRTFTLDDETFAALKTIVLLRQMAGKQATLSSIVEELIKDYLGKHKAELDSAKPAKNYQRQAGLFEVDAAGNFLFTSDNPAAENSEH